MKDEQISINKLQDDLEKYEEKNKINRKKKKIFYIVYSFVVLILYLYLRLYNTEFEYNGHWICLKYSTAWSVRYPAEYKGEKVERLSEAALDEKAPYTLFVYVEDGIKELDSFSNTNVYEINLPKTLERISWGAFENNKYLSKVILPEKVENSLIIDHCAFCNTKIKEIVIPEGTVRIGWKAFANCYYLKEVIIPDSVEKIDEFAFGYCTALEKVKLPDNLEKMDIGLFMGCENLKEISIPKNLKTIYRETFIYSSFDGKDESELNLPEGIKFTEYDYR